MSTYIDIRLRADDEAALAAALETLPLGGHGIALDLIGTLHAETGETATDPETGETIAVTALLPGWHANLRIRDDHPDRAVIEAAVAAFVVTPASPRRVWASWGAEHAD